MKRADIEAFVNRDWAAAQEESDRFWRERKAAIGTEGLFALVDRFNAGLLEMRPDRDPEAERAADLAAHLELVSRFARAHAAVDH